jgi:colicin import membrane protein
MSTVSTSRPPKQRPDDADPFRYGWRYVRITRPDGTEKLDQIPLTLEDVLFPKTGDFIVQTDPHDNDLNYLKDVFKAQLALDPHAAVISDCRVDWNLPGVRPLGPDIAVFFRVKRYKGWATLDVKAERVRPALVVEVTSPETRANDLEDKFDYYDRAKVPLYVIVDALQDDELGRRLKLKVYRRTRTRYREIAPDARGWGWLEPVRVWLGVAQDPRTVVDRVVCYDENGEELGDYTAITQALAMEKDARIQAEARAAEAEQRATEAEARVRELEARFLRRNGQGS